MLEQVVVGCKAVANVILDVGRLALECVERVELACGHRVLHPRDELLVADDPHVLHVGRSGGPVEELIEHVDLVNGILQTRVALGEVDRVSVDTEWLALAIVVVGEGVLHPRQDVGGLVGIEPRVHQMGTRSSTLVKDSIHGDLPEAGQLGLTTADVVHRVAVVGHTVVERIRPEGVRVGVSDGDRGGGARVVGESGAGQVFEIGTAVVEERRAVADDGLVRDTGERVEGDEVAVDLCIGGRLFLMGHGVIADIVAIDVELGDLGIVGVVERDVVRHEWLAAVRVLALGKELVDRVDGVVLHGIVGGEDDKLRDVLGIEAAGRSWCRRSDTWEACMCWRRSCNGQPKRRHPK